MCWEMEDLGQCTVDAASEQDKQLVTYFVVSVFGSYYILGVINQENLSIMNKRSLLGGVGLLRVCSFVLASWVVTVSW